MKFLMANLTGGEKLRLAFGLFWLVSASVLIVKNETHASSVPSTCEVTSDTWKDSDGKSYQRLTNWYACHSVTRGDRVYFRFSDRLKPVVRIVGGVPGDEFDVRKNLEAHEWDLQINQQFLRDADGKTHSFSANDEFRLNLYVAPKQGKLQSRDYIVVSEKSPGIDDSGVLGVVNDADFLAKLIPFNE